LRYRSSVSRENRKKKPQIFATLRSVENISRKGPRNCRSLGSPGFPVESCGFGQLHVVLFRENHISGTGESCEAGNPGTLGRTKGRVKLP
jgi:hypothetical protein